MRELWQVQPHAAFKLGSLKPGSTPGLEGGHQAAKAALPRYREELAGLQDRLWAEAKRSLLVVVQGIDASGKDGTIKHVFEGVNPQATRVTSFKEPTSEELAHDFLWRVHRAMPRRGEIGIFNRSHYEDVLVARVRRLVPEKIWHARYQQIVDFEREIVAGGTGIIKFWLVISKKEQKERFEERLTLPAKRWKFRRSDLDDRALWDEYQQAYRDAIRATATAEAPWYVIPADHKWYRNWAVGVVLIETLKAMRPRYPRPENLDGVVVT
ncbi:MAG: polyphosphate kinase 2 family protein [Candidatus Dormibacteraeota bacterium]|nr:polyphosphate kinase 2 family protein [Candidatus Dormibacteraeota bacterium]